jgi:REP element-mobilizing transposase RayT
MPRQPRMYLPNVPCHIITRGNNGDGCFFSDYDRHFYLDCLNDACTRYQVQTHTYVLMTNHVHLLLTPNDRFREKIESQLNRRATPLPRGGARKLKSVRKGSDFYRV